MRWKEPTTNESAFAYNIRPRGDRRFVNRPYEMTKFGGSIGDGRSKPPPYGKVVRLMLPLVILNEVSIVVILERSEESQCERSRRI